MRRATTFAGFLAAATLALAPLVAPGAGNDLPSIGTPADRIITNQDEYRLGASIYRSLREAGQILDDPEITEYVQSIGSRLASHAQEGNQRFTFFVVRDRGINAFALPGGFIGVNAGLVLATTNESELAGVLAHEIAHVTQRHIARGLEAQGRTQLAATAAMLAAILLGAVSGNSDIGMAGVMAGQSAAVQRQINFTRDNEFEADRIGIQVLAAAGYDPNAMASFFETLGRRAGGAGPNSRILEFLQTHPVTSDRVAEARNRAATFPVARPTDSNGYLLSRERLRVLTLPTDVSVRQAWADAASADGPVGDYRYYGRAVALVRAGEPREAVPMLEDLVRRHPDVTWYHTALGQARLAAGDVVGARDSLAHAKALFPRNVPVTLRYAEALMQNEEPKLAHSILLDLFNTVPPSQEQVRFIALAASAAGETVEATYYMAEFHLMSGELTLAIETLRSALAHADATALQRARFRARIDELKEYLPPRLQAAVDRGEPLPAQLPPQGSARR